MTRILAFFRNMMDPVVAAAASAQPPYMSCATLQDISGYGLTTLPALGASGPNSRFGV